MSENSETNIENSVSVRAPVLLAAAMTALMTAALYTQGRIWWCKLGDYNPWTSDAWSDHTSQHFFDPYSFTHVLHGVLFFWLINLFFRKMAFGWQFFTAITAECVWEIVENSSYIIEKYRENTASLDYFGDSILNSVGDVVACGLGFYIAAKLKFWRSLAFFFLIEFVLLLWIRDGLLINIVMLIHPIEALKKWQMGG